MQNLPSRAISVHRSAKVVPLRSKPAAPRPVEELATTAGDDVAPDVVRALDDMLSAEPFSAALEEAGDRLATLGEVETPRWARANFRQQVRVEQALLALQGTATAPAAPVAASGETVAKYADRWCDARQARVNSIRDDRSRLRDHVLPLVGPLDVAVFTRDDVENVRDALDAKIASGTLSWKTARNVWATFTKLCDDATNAKRRELRVRRDNPAVGVKAPDRGQKKAKQYLFPSELLALVSCEDVPIDWRRNAAVAVYTYLRDGELRELRWEDVDLDHKRIEVSHAFNRRTGKSKAPKTSAGNRTVPIEPTLLPLLRAMHDECKGEGLVVRLPSPRTMARALRRWLRRAGVTRDALYEASATRKPMTWHDMRATGATWLAVRGDPLQVIQRRAGHESMETTMGYVREAESFAGDAFGVPFPELPASLLGASTPIPSPVVAAGSADRVDGSLKRGGRDSNGVGSARSVAFLDEC